MGAITRTPTILQRRLVIGPDGVERVVQVPMAATSSPQATPANMITPLNSKTLQQLSPAARLAHFKSTQANNNLRMNNSVREV